jgi:hypothetical protein
VQAVETMRDLPTPAELSAVRRRVGGEEDRLSGVDRDFFSVFGLGPILMKLLPLRGTRW